MGVTALAVKFSTRPTAIVLPPVFSFTHPHPWFLGVLQVCVSHGDPYQGPHAVAACGVRRAVDRVEDVRDLPAPDEEPCKPYRAHVHAASSESVSPRPSFLLFILSPSLLYHVLLFQRRPKLSVGHPTSCSAVLRRTSYFAEATAER